MTRIGLGLLIVGAVAFTIGGCYFTATEPPPPVLNQIGFACFLGWWLPGLVGLILVIVGLKREHRTNPG